MRRILFIVIPILVVVAFFLYQSLGGGDSLSFALVTLDDTAISGEYFEGRPASPDLEKLFFEMRDQSSFEDSILLSVVNIPIAKEDTIRQFIGIIGNMQTADGYMITAGDYIEVTMDMHTSVRPSPARVREEASAFAESLGRSIKGEEDIQVFTSESEIRILFKAD
jgi:hypothetical protein